MYVNNFINAVTSFVHEHKFLCALTLGLAAVISLRKLSGKTISWLYKCFGTTEKANSVGQTTLNNSTATSTSSSSLKQDILNSKKLEPISEEQHFDLLMESAVHEILPRLFLAGSYKPQVTYNYNSKIIETVKYDLIVSITLQKSENDFIPRPETELFSLPGDPATAPKFDISVNTFKFANQIYLKEAIQKIDQALSAQRKVLVHCQQGIDRSPTVVMAYIMSKYNVTYEQACNFVRSKRRIADPLSAYGDFLKKEFKPVKLD